MPRHLKPLEGGKGGLSYRRGSFYGYEIVGSQHLVAQVHNYDVEAGRARLSIRDRSGVCSGVPPWMTLSSVEAADSQAGDGVECVVDWPASQFSFELLPDYKYILRSCNHIVLVLPRPGGLVLTPGATAFGVGATQLIMMGAMMSWCATALASFQLQLRPLLNIRPGCVQHCRVAVSLS